MGAAEEIRKRVLTWCQVTKSASSCTRWRCHLAAIWQAVSSPGAMSTTTTTPTTTTTEFDAVYRRLIRWRHWMIRRYPTFEDVGAIIDESFWAQHLDGVTEDQRLIRTAEIAVRRHVRSECRMTDLRGRLMEIVKNDPQESIEERVVESVAASQCVRRIDIPPRAWTWLQRDQQPGTLSAADESYGRRWAARTRKELAHVA